MRKLAVIAPVLMSIVTQAAMQTVALPSQSPLISFRFVFRTGSADDPAGKAGLATLMAAMIADAGSKKHTYQQVLDTFYPMAAGVTAQVDKEMLTFSGTTHIDNLDAYYALFRELLLDPGWRADDFKRVKEDQINYLRVSLRGNNDEELGKEVLYQQIYAGHPYGHENAGRVADLESITIADLQAFYRAHLNQANLTIGIGGGYPKDFPQRVQKDFAALPKGEETAKPAALPDPKMNDGDRVTMVEKQTRSVAMSLGHPISVLRGDPDYPALLVAQSWLGQHRNSGGELYQRMRELRGLNYGDYAYIEYFPKGMYLMEPQPNLARRQQIFQVWIRPVEPQNAEFALRLALFELDKMVKDGIPKEEFERTRSFLSKYVNLLLKTKNAQLGYAIDSRYYGIPEYPEYLKAAIAKLTLDDVNRAIKKHIHPTQMDIVIVGENISSLRDKLLSGEPSPIKYNSPKPADVMKEDKIVESWKIPIQAAKVTILPVGQVFE